ncbi:YdcF family protein [Melioribacter sp. OK-6-Me]|uniref:YdcF family protein n=1 Tax=unclassified Melioribacter TaxID=2627329 RepID=UPI003ED871B4
MKAANKQIKLLFFIAAFTVLFLFISTLKYLNNELSPVNYNPSYFGNLLNIAVTFTTITGLLVAQKKKRSISRFFLTLLLTLSILPLILILIDKFTGLLNLLDSYTSEEYFFTFQIKKVHIGLLFLISFFFQLYLAVYLWSNVFFREKFVYLFSLFRTLLLLALFFIISLFYIWFYPVSLDESSSKTYDYALVPGAAVWNKKLPSPIFEARLRKALDLYRNGKIKKIILTGGKAPGELSEADAAYLFLLKLGIDDSSIIKEDKSGTTLQQVKFLYNYQKEKNNSGKIVFISDKFHLPRISQTCSFFGIKVDLIPSGYKMIFSRAFYYRLREGIALILFWLFAI